MNFKMLINGKLVGAESGETIPAINPATGEEFTRIPQGNEKEVDRAVAAAQAALPAWSQMPVQLRTQALQKLGAAIREQAEDLAKLDTLNHGSPIAKSRMWVMGTSFTFDEIAMQGQSLWADSLDMGDVGLAYIHRQPIGVCALITPWNMPLNILATKLASALIMGNTCVVKP